MSTTEFFTEETSDLFGNETFTEEILVTSTLHPLFRLPNNTMTKVLVGKQIYQLVVPLLAIIVVFINGVNVLSSGLILKNKVNPRTTYMFLGNVALADLFTGVALGIGAVFPKEYRNHTVCCIGQGIMISGCLASVWSIGLIAIDRFLYIVHGIKYTQRLNTQRAWALILLSWVIATVPSFIPSLGWNTGLSNNGRICWFVHITPVPIIGLIGVIGLIPIVINFSLYMVILYKAVKKSIQLKKADEGKSEVKGMRISRGGTRKDEEGIAGSRKQQQVSKWKAIKVVIFITGAFIVTWGPYLVCCVIYSLCKDRESCKSLAVLISSPLNMLAFLNSLINPFIYAWWHKPFRQNMARFCLCGKKQHRPTTKSNGNSRQLSKNTSSTDVESERL